MSTTKLPFRKPKLPRIETEMPPEKLINGSSDDYLNDSAIDELMDACGSGDKSKFRSALEALVLNMFEDSKDGS